MYIASLMPSAFSSFEALFSFCLQSFLASGCFPVNGFFPTGDENTGASASVPPMSVQGWFPLKLTGLTSLLFKVLSGVFSSTSLSTHILAECPIIIINLHLSSGGGSLLSLHSHTLCYGYTCSLSLCWNILFYYLPLYYNILYYLPLLLY